MANSLDDFGSLAGDEIERLRAEWEALPPSDMRRRVLETLVKERAEAQVLREELAERQYALSALQRATWND